MKTTSTYPIIITKDLAGTIEFYTKVMDYSVKHDLITKAESHVIVLVNENGNEIELMEASDKMPPMLAPGLHGMRINVDDIEAALQEVQAAGCQILSEIFDTKFSKNLMIQDLNGVNITLMEHKKN